MEKGSRRKLNAAGKRKLLIAGLLAVFLIFLYLIVFVPRDAEDLLTFGKMRLEEIENYHIHLSIQEDDVFTAKDIKALKQFGDDKVTIPVSWEKDLYHTGEGELITCSCHYQFNEKKAGFRQGLLKEKSQEYLLADKQFVAAGETDTAPSSLSGIDLLRLLSVKKAGMRAAGSTYRMTVKSSDAEDVLEEVLGITPKENSKLVFTFDRMTHMLQSISGKGIRTRKRTIDFTLTLTPDDEACEDAIAEASAKTVSAPEKKKKPADGTWELRSPGDGSEGAEGFVVGEDILAGTYTITPKKGRGIILGVSGRSGARLFRYAYGYDYFRIDDMSKEETKKHTLKKGDRIVLSGRKMTVVFRRDV